jgi:hypothetical protein
MALRCPQCGNRVASKRNLARHLSHAHRLSAEVRPAQRVAPVAPVQPQQPRRIESQPSAFSIFKQALGGSTPKPAVANVAAPRRYQRIADIPPELLAKHGLTRQGNALNAPAGVDISAVLRILLK